RADHLAGLEVTHLAGCAGAVVVVVAAQGDGAGAGEAVEHQLHDGGGFLDVRVGEVARREDGRGAAGDIRIPGGIERGRIAELVGRVGRLDVSAARSEERRVGKGGRLWGWWDVLL